MKNKKQERSNEDSEKSTANAPILATFKPAQVSKAGRRREKHTTIREQMTNDELEKVCWNLPPTEKDCLISLTDEFSISCFSVHNNEPEKYTKRHLDDVMKTTPSQKLSLNDVIAAATEPNNQFHSTVKVPESPTEAQSEQRSQESEVKQKSGKRKNSTSGQNLKNNRFAPYKPKKTTNTKANEEQEASPVNVQLKAQSEESAKPAGTSFRPAFGPFQTNSFEGYHQRPANTIPTFSNVNPQNMNINPQVVNAPLPQQDPVDLAKKNMSYGKLLLDFLKNHQQTREMEINQGHFNSAEPLMAVASRRDFEMQQRQQDINFFLENNNPTLDSTTTNLPQNERFVSCLGEVDCEDEEKIVPNPQVIAPFDNTNLFYQAPTAQPIPFQQPQFAALQNVQQFQRMIPYQFQEQIQPQQPQQIPQYTNIVINNNISQPTNSNARQYTDWEWQQLRLQMAQQQQPNYRSNAFQQQFQQQQQCQQTIQMPESVSPKFFLMTHSPNRI